MVFPSGAEGGPRDGDHRRSVDVKDQSCRVLGKLNSSHQAVGLVASQFVSQLGLVVNQSSLVVSQSVGLIVGEDIQLS